MKTLTKQQLTTFIGLQTEIPWHSVCIEIVYSNSGVARIYIRGDKTPFHAGGYGYDKNGVVLSEFLNYYVGSKVSSNQGEGVDSVIQDAKKVGISLEYICSTVSGDLWKLTNLNGVK